MKLTVIGCAGSMSGPRGPASCYLVQGTAPGDDGAPVTTSVLVDLGSGAMGRLLDHVDPADLDLIALSHLHADHMVDLIGMHVYRRWFPAGELPVIPVLAPAGGVARLRGAGGDGEDEMFEEFAFTDVTDRFTHAVGCLTLEFFRVRHPVEAYAIRVTGPAEDDPRRTVALTYSGDTDACDGLTQAANGADLLLSEAAFQEERDAVRGIHLTGLRAGQVAAAAGARRLVLTHLQPWNDPAVSLAEARSAFDGPVELARTDAVWTL